MGRLKFKPRSGELGGFFLDGSPISLSTQMQSSVVSIFIPATARSGGNCSGDRPYLSVLWEPSTSGGRILRDLDSNQLNLYMAQGTSTYFVDAIDLYLMMDAFPDAVEPVLSTNATNLRLFETSKQRSFTCSREEVVLMGRVELVVVNVRLQAFNNDSTVTDFHQGTPLAPFRAYTARYS
uniref:Lysosome-associated membrane glycoprotein 5 n=1 Tax=Timema cristinae TaxID=61476 RepID=A0A7R9DNZ1_TIMCR|nr:unnamed protein product [Timema cristinae]